jgi:glutamate N-acetyltransferase/amino-acid N-acetyltransferase
MSFFASRWVERPGHVTEAEPTALPGGFRAGGAAAGIKPKGLDVGVLCASRATLARGRR